MSTRQFPLFLLKIDGKQKFLTMREAGIMFDSNFSNVENMRLVLEEDFSVRDITKEETSQMSEIADEHSASK